MDRHEQRLVGFLSRPTSYPHPVDAVERRETHISHVFLAGGFAYKLKKPVTFPFLDASTLAKRKRFCQLEVSLNRRLAPRVYLGIVPLVDTSAGFRLGGSGRVVEWLVKMRRLPEERMLDRLIAAGRIRRKDCVRIMDRLVPFFRHARRSRRIADVGRPDRVAQLVLGNLKECEPFIGSLVSSGTVRFIETAYRQYLALHEPTFLARIRQGRIIDGHGDLRCENICVTDGIEIFDCVEFEPAFRYGDVANDLAFLVMDLEFRGRADLASALVARYRERLHDPTRQIVLPLYCCHRTLVRAKVRGLAWRQHPATPEGRRVRDLARRHFDFARRYAEAMYRPRLIVVGGAIGTGKSTLARFLAERLDAELLRTDEIRLREFAHLRRPRQGFAEGLYSPRASELVYQRLIERAERLVRQGRSVVCDGTFSRAVGREQLRRIARQRGASFHFFECIAPRQIAMRRVAVRYAAKSDLSEAKPEHYDRLQAGFEPVHEWSASAWTRLDTDRAPQLTYRAALKALRRAWTDARESH